LRGSKISAQAVAGDSQASNISNWHLKKLYRVFPRTVHGLIIECWVRAAIRGEMARRPFYIDTIVIMPKHIHAIWTLPPNDADYSIRWRNIKRSFTAIIPHPYSVPPFSPAGNTSTNRQYGNDESFDMLRTSLGTPYSG